MLTHAALVLLWKIASYVHDVYQTYEEFYKYLIDMPHEPLLNPSDIPHGSWVSRSMERGFWNTGPLIYTQHHGVAFQTEEGLKISHYLDNILKMSTLQEYMNGERILNVYHLNPASHPGDPTQWNGKYNLVTNNCEHYASLIIDGLARSRLIEVLEHIAWQALWKSHPHISDVKMIPSKRFYI